MAYRLLVHRVMLRALVVSDFMTAPVHTVRDSTPIDQVERRMAEHRISCLPVVDVAGRTVGVVTRFDLLRVGRLRARTAGTEALLDLPRTAVRSIARRRLISVPPEASLAEAARLMGERRVHRVLVLEGERLVGVLGTREVMRAVAAARLEAPLASHHTTPLVTVSVGDPIALATDRLARSRITGVVVLDEGRPIGLFADCEALEARDRPSDSPVEDAMSTALLCLPLGTPLHRAAEAAWTTKARRVLTVDDRRAVGILTGSDFVRALS